MELVSSRYWEWLSSTKAQALYLSTYEQKCASLYLIVPYTFSHCFTYFDQIWRDFRTLLWGDFRCTNITILAIEIQTWNVNFLELDVKGQKDFFIPWYSVTSNGLPINDFDKIPLLFGIQQTTFFCPRTIDCKQIHSYLAFRNQLMSAGQQLI
jgi:hypothetical protein